MNVPPDQQQRLFATDERHSVIVQAPAGSGKTSLLVARYLRLLAHANRPEEILAITFTRKAAGEMRERIITALGDGDEIAQAALQRDAQLGWNLTAQPHRLKIQTIDAFAMSLLRQLPLLSEFDPNVELLEQADDLYQLATQRLFQRLYRDDPLAPYVADFLGWLDNDAAKASRLVVDMLARRDQWLTVVSDIVVAHQAQPGNVEDLLSMGVRHLHRAVLETLEQQLSPTQRRQLERLIDTAASNLELSVSGNLARYRFAGEIFVTQGDQLRKSLTKNQGFPPGTDAKSDALAFLADIRDAGEESLLIHLRHLPPVDLSTAALERLVGVCVTLTLAVVELGQLFGERRVADFTQLTLSARTALSKDDAPTELALALDYRIKHILVDEFQDTSVAQFQLFEQLVAGWQPDAGNTFFAVGDPMQSVYRFRDAEVGLFFQAWHHGIGDVVLERVRLASNFRANASLVHWGNDNFARIFGATEDPLLGQVAYAPAQAVRGPGPQMAVRVCACDSASDEVAQLVRTIQHLQHTDRQSSIAILVRSRNHLQNLLPALRGAGIRWRATDIEPLPDKPVVRDLLALARVMTSPWDRLSWFAIFRSPWVGLSLADLETFAECDDFATAIGAPSERVSGDGQQRLQRLSGALTAGNLLLDEAPPRRALETAWLTAGGGDAYASDADIDCAERLLELVDTLGTHGLDPQALESAAQALYASDAAAAQLEILTIHKSKGLEFDHVLLPFLDRQPRRSDAPLMLWRPQGPGLLLGVKDLDGVYGWLAREDRARENHELKRLLYVACTRARESLHLFGLSQEHRQGSRGSLFSLLPDSLLPNSRLPDLLGDAHSNAHSNAETQTDPQHQRAELELATQTDMFMVRTLQRLKADYRWRPPQVKARRHPTPPAIRSPQLDPTAGSWQVTLGVLMHEALRTLAGCDPLPEVGDFVASQQTAWNRRLQELLVDAGQRQDTLIAMQRQLHNVLEDATGRWILGPHADARCEVPLTGVDAAGSLANVFLDRMFVDADGRRWIIDYKSTTRGASSPGDLVAAEVARYQAQLARYGKFASAIYPEPVRLGLYFTDLPHFEELTQLSESLLG